MREAAEGSIIVMERRGEPVAELLPLTPRLRLAGSEKAHIFRSMRKVWARMPNAADSTQILEDDRSR